MHRKSAASRTGEYWGLGLFVQSHSSLIKPGLLSFVQQCLSCMGEPQPVVATVDPLSLVWLPPHTPSLTRKGSKLKQSLMKSQGTHPAYFITGLYRRNGELLLFLAPLAHHCSAASFRFCLWWAALWPRSAHHFVQPVRRNSGLKWKMGEKRKMDDLSQNIYRHARHIK